MADIKSKSNEGQKKSHMNAIKKKGPGEKPAVLKEKQSNQQQQQNQRQNQKSQVNNKAFKKKKQQQQQQQPQQQQQQQEFTKKKVHEQKSKQSLKNAKDKGKEVKNKGNKKPAKQVTANKRKGKGSFIKKIFEMSFFAVIISMAFLWYLYIVDIDKYRSVRDFGIKAVYSMVQLLPTGVVAKGSEVIEYIRPTVEVAVFKLQMLVNQTSTVLNTNPVLKDHWSNINEISTVIGEQIADYMRTVYKQIPIYFDNAKNKFF